MSTELAPGAVNLEDEPAAITPPPTEPAAPDPQTPQDEPDPEGTVEIPSGKVVPLAALQETRGKVKELNTALSAKDQEIAQLREKAAKVDQIQQEWQAVQPLIQQIKTQPPAAPKPAETDPHMVVGKNPVTGAPITLLDYTKTLDLYDPSGRPDIERGLALLGVQQYQADRRAQAHVAPIQQHTAATQAQQMRASFAQIKDANGKTVNPAVLDQMFAIVPPEMAARQDVATVLYYAAKGLEAHGTKGAAPPPPPVLPTESVGDGIPAKTELTTADRRMMEAAGIGEKEFTKIASGFKPGQRNVLE